MATREEMEARVRQLAAERGLDPNRWAKIVQGESSWNPSARLTTNREDSGGLFQLNTKNGVGVDALKAGIDPHDPAQWERQAVFALDYAKKHGDRAWSAARKLDGKPTQAAAAPRRPDGAPGPVDVPTRDVNLSQGTLSSIYAPFQKIAEEQKVAADKQEAAQKAATQAVAELQTQQAPQPAPQPPPPPAPAGPPADFAALMLPRVRRGLLADPSDYGLLGGRYS